MLEVGLGRPETWSLPDDGVDGNTISRWGGLCGERAFAGMCLGGEILPRDDAGFTADGVGHVGLSNCVVAGK